MKLTPHEQKILKIIKANPKVVNQPSVRGKIANKHGLTEKTLRNRIAELRKRGLLEETSKINPVEIKSLITENDEINISALIDLIKRKKKFFLKFSFLTTLIGLAYSLLATIFFASKITASPISLFWFDDVFKKKDDKKRSEPIRKNKANR